MNLAALAVRRGVTFGMIFLVLTGFGVFALSRLQLDLYPDMQFPMVLAITTYTGASPEDMETLVTKPLEGAVSAVKGVEKVTSQSKQSTSVVTAEFGWDKDMEQAETEMRRKIDMVKGILPDDADEPLIFAMDPSMQPIVMMMVSGPYPPAELRRIADDKIQPALERLDGIASAEVAGGKEREIHVSLSPHKVTAFGLDVGRILAAIYQENTQEPSGAIQQGTLDFTIQSKGKYRSIKEIGEVVVGTRVTAAGIEKILLKDVAAINDSFVENQRVLKVDGKDAVFIIVRKQSGTNTVKTAESVMKLLPKINRMAGVNVDFKVIFNQSDFINASLSNLSSSAMVAIVIVFIVLLIFLHSIRSSLVVVMAIPLSLVTTFFVMERLGMTLNVISMAGLALAVGMLVDNAIVVLENIFRLRQEGTEINQAAILGTKQVSIAVTASTLTTIVVFVPVLFVSGIAGILFKDMAITICLALTVSLLMAITFVPLSASRLLRSSRYILQENNDHPGIYIRFRRSYERTLRRVLAHRWIVAVSLGGMIAATIVLMRLMPTEFMMSSDQSFLIAQVKTPVGNNVHETEKTVDEAVNLIRQVIPARDRKMISEDVGVGTGFIALFSAGVHSGIIRIPLSRVSERETSQADYENTVRNALKKLPGVEVIVGNPMNMTGAGDIEISILGHDLKESRRVGILLKEKLLAMPDMAEATFSIENQKPEITVVFDRKKMAAIGLSTAAVGRAISVFFMGRVAGRYSEGGDEYNILVRFDKQYRLDIDELKRMPVSLPTGETVPLSNIAEVIVDLGPVDIARRNQERVSTLTCTLAKFYRDSAGEIQTKDFGATIGRVEKLLSQFVWPENFSYHVGGTAEDFKESFGQLGIALLISVFLVYMVMASQFESFRQPFVILFTVPLAALGVVLTFVVTRSTMDVAALIGVIMLVGIVVNNGIVMVDCANQLRAEGLDRFEAIARASSMRLRPVLLTSLTTILGMVPLALEIGEGAEAWSGMAKAVIGGLTFATALTLFVVPTMYTLFAARKERIWVSE